MDDKSTLWLSHCVAGNDFILERQTEKTYFQELIGNFRNWKWIGN